MSEHIKGKFNVKGFAAKIEHNLAKGKPGARRLTKMINTDLINLADTALSHFETQASETPNEPYSFFIKSLIRKSL